MAVAGVAGSRYAIATMTVSGAIVAVGLGFFAVSGSLWMAVLALVIVGGGSSGYQLLQNALLMEAAAPEFHGRVMSVVMLAWGINGLVALPFGLLADAIGERETLAVMAVLTLLVQMAVIVAHSSINRRGPRMAGTGAELARPRAEG